MSNATYTPGPWRNCDPSSNFEKGFRIIKNSDGKTIATITKNFKIGENIAHSNLIAAAPDMAEALRKIIAIDWNGDITPSHPYTGETAEQIAADALAKAGVA